jgi:UDP-GlcNAc:undecaprenyl-phosphate GlcNAc-1-phosphate transferase
MAFAFVRRTARGTGFQTPDKDHIHHRLLRLGHGHRRSVVILWAWTAILSGFILFPLFVRAVNPFIPLGVALLAVALYTWFHPDLRHRAEAAQRDPASGAPPPSSPRPPSPRPAPTSPRPAPPTPPPSSRPASSVAAARSARTKSGPPGAVRRVSPPSLPSDRFADRRDRMG